MKHISEIMIEMDLPKRYGPKTPEELEELMKESIENAKKNEEKKSFFRYKEAKKQ